MARGRRILSNIGVYHLIDRGIDRQNIFRDEIDKLYFIKQLKKYSEEENGVLYCYCLMDNHYHLLMYFKEEESPAVFMKKLEVKYVGYFNDKYDRSGSLFEGRYRSECVNDRQYFMKVFRYICQNPIKARMVTRAEDYRFSTAYEIKSGRGISKLEPVYGEIPKHEIIEYINEKTDFKGLNAWDEAFTDDECVQMYKKLCEKYGFERRGKRCTKEFDAEFRQMFKYNAGITQLSKVTGISRVTLTKILK